MKRTSILLKSRNVLFNALLLAILFSASITSASCASSNNDSVHESSERKDVVLTKDEESLVTSTNTFAFQALSILGEENDDVLFSPLSLGMLMGMLQNGASGETQSQIINTLGFAHCTSDEVNAYYRKMLTAAATLDPQVTLSIANALYIEKHFSVYPTFIETAQKMYDSEIGVLDFTQDPVGMINSWCNDHTEGKIPEIIKELDPSMVVVLLNAIYFKGDWSQQFDPEDTAQKTFTSSSGATQQVDMMYLKASFDYFENDHFAGVELPYGNKAFSMVVMLPKNNQTPLKALATLDESSWHNLYAKKYRHDIQLTLPKFETKSEMNLIPAMTKLGITDVFNPAKADFSNVSEQGTFLSLLKQKTYLKLDEVGTEAAAVTIGGLEKTSLPPPPIIFTVDRPFLYMIKENSTGCIYFIGLKNTI